MPGTRRIPKPKNNEPDLNGLLEPEEVQPDDFFALVQPDDLLAVVVGSKPLPRTELAKKLWVYIKKNKLQDAKKRTQINADDALKAVFNGKKSVSMFAMTKLVSGHLKSAGKDNSLTKGTGTNKGRTIRKPPADGCAALIVMVIIFVFIFQCVSARSAKPAKHQQQPTGEKQTHTPTLK